MTVLDHFLFRIANDKLAKGLHDKHQITDLTLRIFDDQGEEIPVDLHNQEFNFFAPRTATHYNCQELVN